MTVTFRVRLLIAFVAVAALSGGILATTSYLLTAGYRRDAFERQAAEQARITLVSARGEASLEAFETVLNDAHGEAPFSTVVVDDDLSFSSSPQLDVGDVPDAPLPSDGDLLVEDLEVDGEPFHVIGARVPSAGTGLYFFFSRRALESSLAEHRRTLALGWLAAVAISALVGRTVARRTLRPVRRVAEASQSLAEGLLDTRLQPADDEFGTLSASFNHMASAVERQVEALRASSERERRFTADVAHELRTPLAGLVSAAGLLEAHLPDISDEARRPAELLVDDVRRLRDLVIDLLELARLDAGREEPQIVRLSVRRSIDSVIAPWRHDVTVDVEVADGLEVLADPVRFGRVLGNLLANGVRHGGGNVEIAARSDGDRVVIEVMDRGPGIPPEQEESIFERFVKLDPTRSANGSGLGLAIAHQQATVQHGALSVHRRVGGGTTFRLELPAVEEPAEEADPSADAPEPRPRATCGSSTATPPKV